MMEHVSSYKKIMLKMEIPKALESALIPLVMLLTYKKMKKYQIYEETQPKTQKKMRNNNIYFIVHR